MPNETEESHLLEDGGNMSQLNMTINQSSGMEITMLESQRCNMEDIEQHQDDQTLHLKSTSDFFKDCGLPNNNM